MLDVWKYRRGDELRAVELEPRMVSDDMDWMMEAAVRGAGVVRLIDLKTQPFLHTGLLDPVLGEWEGLEAPPIHVLYRRGARPSARVRAFVEFASELCADLQSSQPGEAHFAVVPMPRWFRTNWVGSLTRRASLQVATVARPDRRQGNDRGAAAPRLTTRP